MKHPFLTELSKISTKLYIRHAKANGMKIGNTFRCMGRVNFGSEPYLIHIGNHVTISFDVAFITHDGATWVLRDNDPECKGLSVNGTIVIHDNCFIGARATILQNVEIGPNSIVAAGAVVTKTVPPNCVYGGIPARFLKSLDDYKKKCLLEGQFFDPAHKREVLEKLMLKNHL